LIQGPEPGEAIIQLGKIVVEPSDEGIVGTRFVDAGRPQRPETR
jgi:hypothetical protein